MGLGSGSGTTGSFLGANLLTVEAFLSSGGFVIGTAGAGASFSLPLAPKAVVLGLVLSSALGGSTLGASSAFSASFFLPKYGNLA